MAARASAARGAGLTDLAQSAERSAGLIALTGPPSGGLGAHLLADRRDEAARLLARWRDVFGDRLAVEVQLHHTGGRRRRSPTALIELAERARVPWVVATIRATSTTTAGSSTTCSPRSATTPTIDDARAARAAAPERRMAAALARGDGASGGRGASRA